MNIKIEFDDGSGLSISCGQGQAETTYLLYLQPVVERLHRDQARRRGVCCDHLHLAIFAHVRREQPKSYPRLAFISESDLARPGAAWTYPGALKPGYYKIYEVHTPADEEERITYVPLESCPFCYADLRHVVKEEL